MSVARVRLSRVRVSCTCVFYVCRFVSVCLLFLGVFVSVSFLRLCVCVFFCVFMCVCVWFARYRLSVCLYVGGFFNLIVSIFVCEIV